MNLEYQDFPDLLFSLIYLQIYIAWKIKNFKWTVSLNCTKDE
jgi:hypothetical protein